MPWVVPLSSVMSEVSAQRTGGPGQEEAAGTEDPEL